jgi:hypothetical protein
MGAGSASGGGGFDWASLFGSIFGGGKAGGGMVAPNMMYSVNENGPELLSVGGRDLLMMGGQAGRVTPNHRLGGGNAISQNFYTMGVETRRTTERKAQLAGRAAQRSLSRNGN